MTLMALKMNRRRVKEVIALPSPFHGEHRALAVLVDDRCDGHVPMACGRAGKDQMLAGGHSAYADPDAGADAAVDERHGDQVSGAFAATLGPAGHEHHQPAEAGAGAESPLRARGKISMA